MIWATLLTSENQLKYLMGCRFIEEYEILDYNARLSRSKQSPQGYAVVRAKILYKKATNDFERKTHSIHFISRFCPGDEGYEDYGYHNEFKVI